MINQQPDFNGLTLLDRTLMRLREFEPPEGYYGAFSGGKDSVLMKEMVKLAGVKADWHYMAGGTDPPELIRFIKDQHPDVIIERPEGGSIWRGIAKKGMPRRNARWCCEWIKEGGGVGRLVITGIRWAESSRRRQRKMVEICTTKSKRFLHPIIDWTNADVWGFIKERQIPYCSLYDEGFKRLGCVLCPMGSPGEARLEMERWPKISEAWRRAAYRYFEANSLKHPEDMARWASAEAFWNWWLSRRAVAPKEQCRMFGDN